MRRRWLGPGLGAVLCRWGCATGGGPGPGGTLSVGQRQEDLVARLGKPQEIQAGPGGSKTYVYTTENLDQTATMSGGAWVKPDQVYYTINDQGVITEVKRYPYGKRSFLWPSKEKPAQLAQAPVPGEQGAAKPTAPAAAKAPETQAPQAAAPPPPAAPGTARAQPQVPGSPPRAGVDGASRLELNMSREEVRRVLGSPERTEGFRAGSRGVIVWYYWLEGPQGRRTSTPLVFEDGRLSGWGETFYQRRLREISSQQP